MKESVIYQDCLAQGRRQGQVSLILHLLKRRIGEIKLEEETRIIWFIRRTVRSFG